MRIGANVATQTGQAISVVGSAVGGMVWGLMPTMRYDEISTGGDCTHSAVGSTGGPVQVATSGDGTNSGDGSISSKSD